MKKEKQIYQKLIDEYSVNEQQFSIQNRASGGNTKYTAYFLLLPLVKLRIAGDN